MKLTLSRGLVHMLETRLGKVYRVFMGKKNNFSLNQEGKGRQMSKVLL